MSKVTPQSIENDVYLLCKKTGCLLQHHGVKLADIIPGLLEAFNTTNLELLHVASLIQIGQYVLEEDKVSDEASVEFISQLASIVIRSVDVKDPSGTEDLSARCCFLIALWHKKDAVTLKLGEQKTLEDNWNQYIQIILLDMVEHYHNDPFHQSNMFDPTSISFLKLCRQSPLILEEAFTVLCGFVIHSKGCGLMARFVEEFMKRVGHDSQDSFVSLFSPKYEKLICHLPLSPDDVKDKPVVMELLVSAFSEEKHRAFGLMLCFPLWLPHLVQYYEENYGKNFFDDFHF